MAYIVEFISTSENRGEGTEKDPVRNVDQLWTKNGHLIAEYDPCGESWYMRRLEETVEIERK